MFAVTQLNTVHTMHTAGEYVYVFLRLFRRPKKWMLSDPKQDSFSLYLPSEDIDSPLPHDSPAIRIHVRHPLGMLPKAIPDQLMYSMIDLVVESCCAVLAEQCPNTSRCICVLGGAPCHSILAGRPRNEFSIHGSFGTGISR